MEADQWTRAFGPFDGDGTPVEVDALATTEAIRAGRPAHATLHDPRRRAARSSRSRRARSRSSPPRSGSSGAMILFWPLVSENGGEPVVKLKVWGARGSVPAPGPHMNRYGGNTSCVQLTLASGEELILDAGTGIRTLGLDLAAGQADPHPAHPPAPRPHPGADVLPALLPRRLRDHDLGPVVARGLARGPDRPLHLGAAVAGRGPRAAVLGLVPRHAARPSGSSAGRRSAPRRSPTAGRRSATGSPTARRRSPTSPTTSRRSARRSTGLEPEWISGFDLARDADLLIHDCQYTDDEYPEHVGWGHSALSDTLTFARAGRGQAADALPPRPAARRRVPRRPLRARARPAGRGSAATRRRSRWRWRAASSRSDAALSACPRLRHAASTAGTSGSVTKFRHADNDRGPAAPTFASHS